jgi:hypothetical protein
VEDVAAVHWRAAGFDTDGEIPGIAAVEREFMPGRRAGRPTAALGQQFGPHVKRFAAGDAERDRVVPLFGFGARVCHPARWFQHQGR